jgi:hypothetical protein
MSRLGAAYILVDNCTLLRVDGYPYLRDIDRRLQGGLAHAQALQAHPLNRATAHEP